MRLNKDATTHILLTEGWNTMLIILHGTVLVNNKEIAREGQTVVFDQSGSEISVEANTDAIVLLLAGEPINKPVVGHGPFVMNSVREIHQAIDDFNSGKFGQMAE